MSEALQESGGQKFFHLLVTNPYDSRYWLHIEAAESATLQTLDWFLREIWVECCGHLSQFSIGGPKRTLKDVLAPHKQFSYEYDFGSTTELALRVLSHGLPASAQQGSVWLLARNDSPSFACRVCGKIATDLCTECQQEVEELNDEAHMFFCETCIGKKAVHPHDEEMRLPVVNSPRMGVCGYTG
ncbi:MAG: hypothetical protein AAB947_00405 [Patescibacteria group bacterium]